LGQNDIERKKYVQDMTSLLEHWIGTRATKMITLRVAIKHRNSSAMHVQNSKFMTWHLFLEF
jgi:hypothetical protein